MHVNIQLADLCDLKKGLGIFPYCPNKKQHGERKLQNDGTRVGARIGSELVISFWWPNITLISIVGVEGRMSDSTYDTHIGRNDILMDGAAMC